MGFERTEASEPVKFRLSLSLSKTVDSPIFYTILIEVARKGEFERAFF